MEYYGGDIMTLLYISFSIELNINTRTLDPITIYAEKGIQILPHQKFLAGLFPFGWVVNESFDPLAPQDHSTLRLLRQNWIRVAAQSKSLQNKVPEDPLSWLVDRRHPRPNPRDTPYHSPDNLVLAAEKLCVKLPTWRKRFFKADRFTQHKL